MISPFKAGIIKKLGKLGRYSTKITEFKILAKAKNADELISASKTLVKGGAKTFDNALVALKKNTKLQDHIFKGDLRNVTGCHYRQAVDGVDIRFVNDAIPEANSLGVLKGDIEIRRELLKPGGLSYDPPQFKWVKKNMQGDPQTFFPSTWSKDEILEQCASALSNPQKALVPGKTKMYVAESNSGVFIRWFEDSNGNVTSIFPEF